MIDLVNEVKNEVNKNIMLQINQNLYDDEVIDYDTYTKMKAEIEKS